MSMTDLNSSSGPSPHLYWNELACKDGTDYPQEFIADGRCQLLADVFESLRTFCDCPLTISSGYRTKAHQIRIYKRLGQRPLLTSQHIEGRALDIKKPRKYRDVLQFHLVVGDWAKGDKRVGGVGFYKWGIHLDVRPRKGGRYVAWGSDAALKEY